MKKIISAVICAALLAGSLSACGKEEKPTKKYVAQTRPTTSAQDLEADATEASEAAEETQPDTESEPAESILDLMTFTLDGTQITLDRLPYADLKKLGWSYDPEIYGLTDFTAEIGVLLQRSVSLLKDGCDPEVFYAGFTNFNDEPCGLDDVQLWSIQFVAKDRENYPEVTLAKNITWGADEAAVRAAYGTPTTSAKGSGMVTLGYEDAVGRKLTLEIYDNDGLRKITMDAYA